jgi:flagellar motor switch protein FliM
MEPAESTPNAEQRSPTDGRVDAPDDGGSEEQHDAPLAHDGEPSTDGTSPGEAPTGEALLREPPAPTPTVRPFDFRRPSKLNRDHIRNLEMVHETFAGQFATVLSSSLRVVATMDVSSINEVTYDEYVHALPSQTHMVFLSLDPLPGLTTLQLPLDSALVLVDLLLGGQGLTVPERPLTEIEASLVRKLLERGLEDLAYAYEPVQQLEPSITGHESNPQFAQTAAPSDLVVVVRFLLDLATSSETEPAPITLCYPLSSLQPILDAVAGTPQHGDSVGEVAHARRAMALRINEVPVELCVRFRARPLSAEEILALSPGDVLVLPHAADAPLTASVGEQPMFAVQPARRGRKVAVQVTERLDIDRLDGFATTGGTSGRRPASGTETDR